MASKGNGTKPKPKSNGKRSGGVGSKKKIEIKPSKRGSFEKWCKSKGYGGVTSKCIAQGKKSKSSAIRKKATFAQNARKWNKK